MQSKGSYKLQYFILFFVALFLCSGYMCGSDWRGYESEYTAKEESLILEPGYYFLAKAAQLIGIGFWEFEITLKFICLIIFYKSIQNYCHRNKYLCILFYFSFYAIYLFIDGPLRNLCAIGLFLIALRLYDKSKILAVVLSISGLLFHSSSIIGFVYFILRIVSENGRLKHGCMSVYIFLLSLFHFKVLY